MSYNQVIVVEGKHDEQKIKAIFPEIECIVTNGSEISEETLNLIYKTSLNKEVVLLLDPDYPGKKITEKILNTKGLYKFAYVPKKDAISVKMKKVGIEHASNEVIILALDKMLSLNYDTKVVTNFDLQKRGLINAKESRKIRSRICDILQIPSSNGKTFLKYLNMLNIPLERIDEIINDIT